MTRSNRYCNHPWNTFWWNKSQSPKCETEHSPQKGLSSLWLIFVENKKEDGNLSADKLRRQTTIWFLPGSEMTQFESLEVIGYMPEPSLSFLRLAARTSCDGGMILNRFFVLSFVFWESIASSFRHGCVHLSKIFATQLQAEDCRTTPIKIAYVRARDNEVDASVNRERELGEVNAAQISNVQGNRDIFLFRMIRMEMHSIRVTCDSLFSAYLRDFVTLDLSTSDRFDRSERHKSASTTYYGRAFERNWWWVVWGDRRRQQRGVLRLAEKLTGPCRASTYSLTRVYRVIERLIIMTSGLIVYDET